MAAARVLNRHIHVVSSACVRVIDCPIADNAPIWLAYNGIHYDAVVSAPAAPCLVALALCAQQSVDVVSAPVSLGSCPAQPQPPSRPVCASDPSAGLSDLTDQSASSAASSLLDFADIIGLQESRHTELGISSLAAKIRSVGYNILFGYHMLSC